MTDDPRAGIFTSVINFARTKHAGEIDKAYSEFWDEEDPEDFLSGTALELAFINFEDWFVCDYRTGDDDSIIDFYIEASDGLDSTERSILEAMQDSYISLYELLSPEGTPRLRDAILGEEFTSDNGTLKTLNTGDLFATRFINLGERRLMSRCVYPFRQDSKDRIFEFIEKHKKRYFRNQNPEGTMEQFLKDEGYFFNVVWINLLFKHPRAT